jgi:hypothetical protein
MIDFNDIVFPLPPPINRFYVYYDKSDGTIIALTNGIIDTVGFDDYIEIPPVMHERLSNGTEKISQWMVSAVTTPDKEPVLELIPRKFKGLSFKNNSFDLILDVPLYDTELIVEWSGLTKHWVIGLSPDTQASIMGKHFATDKLSFFVVLENDFDFLIRSIYISPYELANKKIYIPFSTKLEENINNIAVVTRRIFNSYGLIKTYE